MSNRRGGRPPALTPEVQERIVAALTAGNTRKDAAVYAGVSERALYYWLAKGRKARRSPYVQLMQAVKKAEADAVVTSVARIRQAAQGGQIVKHTVTTRRDGSVVEEKTFSTGQWTADAWWLERRRYEDWALKDRKVIAELIEEVKRLRAEVHAQGNTAQGPAPAGASRNGHGGAARA